MRAKALFLFLWPFFWGCIPGLGENDQLVRKNISDGNISVKWYYYSLITNKTPDFVVVRKGDREQEIFEAEGVITDVSIVGKRIIIKEYKPERGIVYTKEVLSDVFGYKIKLDSSATLEDYRNTPDGVRE